MTQGRRGSLLLQREELPSPSSCRFIPAHHRRSDSLRPAGTRLIVRRERPHPGAQFTIFDEQGYRHTCFLTDQHGEDITTLELRHRGRARVEDRIRAAKDTGMRNLPHHAFAHNETWLEVSLIAQDLLTWTKLTCLQGDLAKAEPKRLRHRLLHTAGRIIRHGRRTQLRVQADWPWATELATAFIRLRAIPSLC
jgi:Transposase DDE domain group 1